MSHPILLAAGLLASSLLPTGTQLDGALGDRLLLKVDRVLPHSVGEGLPFTGDPALDRELAAEGVLECRRVFRHPVRGWRDPDAAERVGLDRWLVVRFAGERADLQEVAARFRRLPEIERCQLDLLGTPADTYPDDPHFFSQYALQNGLLNAPQAWDVRTESDRVVAIIDSGADLDHPDLLDNLWRNPGEIVGNGVDDDANGYVDDVVGWDFAYGDNTPEDGYGHGIHVSGIAGARTNNGLQVAGVCWSVPVMQVQIIDDGGGAPQSRAAAAIVYSADNGASVLNNSYGYFLDGQILEDAVHYAAALDAVIVAAAHNQGGDTEVYPAAYDEVMGIIATDASDNKPSWSNFGSWCDMAAPGQSVLSLWFGGGTTLGSGTSMSSPHVAGAAALVLAANPSLDGVDARWVLNDSAADLGSPGFDVLFGWGRLDLAAALRRAQSLTISKNVALPGDAVTFELSQPGEPGFVYALLASRDGRVPGTPASEWDPADPRRIPLNFDSLGFLEVALQNPTARGVFMTSIGILDGAGKGAAVLKIPAMFAGGLELDFAFLTFDPADLSRISSISASTHLEVQ